MRFRHVPLAAVLLLACGQRSGRILNGKIIPCGSPQQQALEQPPVDRRELHEVGGAHALVDLVDRGV
jgi:hypothetical protein